MTAQKWVSTEISFTAKKAINNIHEAEIDVTFKNVESGTTILMPAFWDGGSYTRGRVLEKAARFQ